MSRRTRTTSSAGTRATVTSAPSLPLWPFAAVGLAAVAAYVNAPGHPFVLDDMNAIVDNTTIHDLASSLAGGPFQSATAGRPLLNLSFALNYAAGALNPWGYHAVNIALHVACALLVFALLRRLFRLPLASSWVDGADTGLAAAAALLWAVHPLNSDVIDYATQRSEGLHALFVLLTCYGGIRSLDARGALKWQALAVLAAFSGVASKESAVIAPVLLLVVESAFTMRSPLRVLRERALFYGLLFASWLALGALIVGGPRWRSAGFASGVSPWTYLLEQAPMIVRYLRLVFVPTGLVLDYGLPTARTFTSALPSGLVVVALIGATVAALRLLPLVGVFGAWFFIALAPTSSILPIATEVGAERRMYLPLVAVLAVLVLGAWRLLRRRMPAMASSPAPKAAVALLCVVLAGLTLLRNREYNDPLGLWASVVERWPNGRAHYNYGIVLKAAGRRAEAIAQYELAVKTTPDAEYALGFEQQADGKYLEALNHYQAFVAAKPLDVNVPRAYHQMGRALLSLGRQNQAVMAFREALTRNRNDVDSLGGLGDTLMAQREFGQVVPVWQQYIALKPDNLTAYLNLGLALVELNRDAEARDIFARAVQLDPRSVPARVNHGYALANTGDYGSAVREFRQAAAMETDPAGRAEIEGAIATLLGAH